MGRMAWGALLLGLALAAQAEEPGLKLASSAVVDVDATGKAHVVTLDSVDGPNGPLPTALSQPIETRLRERIESWQFVPATRDGVAVSSRTRLGVSLRAVDDGHGGVAVHVVSVGTGGAIREKHMADLISAFIHYGSQVYLVADVHYAGDGSVIDVDVTDQRVLSGGRFISHADRNMRKAVERALRRWTFETEVVAGQPIEGHGRLPIWVCDSAACETAARDVRASDGNQEFASNDPAVKLRSAVAGTAL